MKKIKIITLISLLSLPMVGFANETETESFKSKIDNILNQNLNKEDVLLVNTPEAYIWNLKTTDFVKGLMYETSIVLDFLSKNSKDLDKLKDFNREFQQNTTCFSIVVGSGKHFNMIHNLTLKTPEQKESFLEAYAFLAYQVKPYPMSKDYIDLCYSERTKAVEYSNKIK
jgi:hypothetical protein